jgi:hypothetical protein
MKHMSVFAIWAVLTASIVLVASLASAAMGRFR